MSDELFAVLEYLANHPQIPYKTIDHLFGDNAHLVLHLRDMEYVSIKQENPNLRHLLPEDQQQDYFVFIKSEGLEAYRLEKKMRDERAKEEERKHAQDVQMALDKKKDHRHDFHVAAFGGAVTLFVEHIGDVIDFLEFFLSP